MEQETIRARRIELYDDQGRRRVVLEGGGHIEGQDVHPGLVVLGPDSSAAPLPSATLILGHENGLPYFLLNTDAGAAVMITFGEQGQPRIALRDEDGNERTIEP